MGQEKKVGDRKVRKQVYDMRGKRDENEGIRDTQIELDQIKNTKNK